MTDRMEQVTPFKMDGMIPNPNQDELIDIDAGRQHGHFMNSVFLFRPKGRLFDLLCKCGTDDWL